MFTASVGTRKERKNAVNNHRAVLAYAAAANAQDFLAWTEKECNRIAQKSTVTESLLGSAFRSLGSPINQVDLIYTSWLTEPTAKAFARLVQLSEREKDARAVEVADELHKPGSYSLLVGSIGATSFSGTNLTAFTNTPDARTPTTIFLQDGKDNKRFVRLKAIERVPFSLNAIFPKAVTGTAIILRFEPITDEGKPLVESLKQGNRV